ncbi:MAG: DUF4321 domain-containing protein [Epulopiscium sp.]|nr:DUF4321 domain-containing protein [Candidatus Epulonipiscium sp.]
MRKVYGGKGKNSWSLFLLLLGGIVIGGFIGHYLGKVPYMQWINYGQEFGLQNPIILDLSVIYIQFSIKIEITIASILGIIAAILIYKRI